MRSVAALVVAALLAQLAPELARAAEPVPPPGEKHLVLAPGQELKLADGTTSVTPADAKDPRFGGIYASPALARYDLDAKLYREEYAKQAIQVAEAERFRGFVVGTSVGIAIGIAIGVFVKGVVK